MILVSVCLPSDALSQYLPSYLGFSYLGCGVSFHGFSSKAQLLLLTLDEEIEGNNRMGKTRGLFKKIRDTKGTFHAKMGSRKDRNGIEGQKWTEAEDIKKRWQEYWSGLAFLSPGDLPNLGVKSWSPTLLSDIYQ